MNMNYKIEQIFEKKIITDEEINTMIENSIFHSFMIYFGLQYNDNNIIYIPIGISQCTLLDITLSSFIEFKYNHNNNNDTPDIYIKINDYISKRKGLSVLFANFISLFIVCAVQDKLDKLVDYWNNKLSKLQSIKKLRYISNINYNTSSKNKSKYYNIENDNMIIDDKITNMFKLIKTSTKINWFENIYYLSENGSMTPLSDIRNMTNIPQIAESFYIDNRIYKLCSLIYKEKDHIADDIINAFEKKMDTKIYREKRNYLVFPYGLYTIIDSMLDELAPRNKRKKRKRSKNE